MEGECQIVQNLKDALKVVMADLFKCDVSEIQDTTGPGDLPAWDSLGHVALMARIQDRFGQHVPVEDAIEVESVADLVAILQRLQGASQ
jgi:acyl carrier protein